MFHPVGPQPPAVYWRRRLFALASAALLLVLLVLTARTVFSGGGQPALAGPTGTATGAATGQAGPSTGATSGASSGATGQSTAAGTGAGSSTGATPSGSASGSGTSTTPAACTAAQLAVKAVVGKPRYAIGDHPVLTLQVTDNGPRPCVQNVADSQIVLRVYNGASRVWGSHDCQIQPGVDNRTLEVGKPAGFSIVWSGLTSQPNCAGTRQRVGAGTYTLYAALSGHEGTATQFTIS